jgi:hypothetical protein
VQQFFQILGLVLNLSFMFYDPGCTLFQCLLKHARASGQI